MYIPPNPSWCCSTTRNFTEFLTSLKFTWCKHTRLETCDPCRACRYLQDQHFQAQSSATDTERSWRGWINWKRGAELWNVICILEVACTHIGVPIAQGKYVLNLISAILSTRINHLLFGFYDNVQMLYVNSTNWTEEISNNKNTRDNRPLRKQVKNNIYFHSVTIAKWRFLFRK